MIQDGSSKQQPFAQSPPSRTQVQKVGSGQSVNHNTSKDSNLVKVSESSTGAVNKISWGDQQLTLNLSEERLANIKSPLY